MADVSPQILRQGSFIDKMVNLGWTATGRFDEDDSILRRSVARYHAFLDLASATPTLIVPTLDIDLAWHTHQLHSESESHLLVHLSHLKSR